MISLPARFLLPVILSTMLGVAAQNSTQRIPIPMKNGLIWYESAGEFNPAGNRKAQFASVMRWYQKHFSGAEHKILVNNGAHGRLVISAAFRVNTSAT